MRPAAVVALSLTLLAKVALAQGFNVPSPRPGTFVHDGAGLLSNEQIADVESLTRTLEPDGIHLALLTIKNAQGASPKSIAVDTLNRWNVGRRSVLLLICMEPHALFVQPGTDLASSFDLATASAICSEKVAPLMRSGDHAGAIRAGLEAIIARARPVSPTPAPASEPTPPPSTTDALLGLTLCGCPLLAVGVGFFFGIRAIWRATRRKCKQCGSRMSSKSRTVVFATEYTPGSGETTYNCQCGFVEVIAYDIGVITRDSGSSSSSGPSSDGSGGGGSSW